MDGFDLVALPVVLGERDRGLRIVEDPAYLSVGIRLVDRDGERPDREDALRELARLREPLYREVADLVLDTDGLTAAEAATRLGLTLAQCWSFNGVAA